MDYKTLMGYGTKKKTIKKESKPKKNKIVEHIRNDLKRWSKSFDGNTGLTEFELQQGKVYTDKDLPPFKTEQKINETIPAFSKQWKTMQKAEKLYEKSVMDLSKAVSKVDKTHSKTISGLWKDISNSLKQFKDLLSKEVLDKLQ
jgi:hypothetical protein